MILREVVPRTIESATHHTRRPVNTSRTGESLISPEVADLLRGSMKVRPTSANAPAVAKGMPLWCPYRWRRGARGRARDHHVGGDRVLEGQAAPHVLRARRPGGASDGRAGAGEVDPLEDAAMRLLGREGAQAAQDVFLPLTLDDHISRGRPPHELGLDQIEAQVSEATTQPSLILPSEAGGSHRLAHGDQLDSESRASEYAPRTARRASATRSGERGLARAATSAAPPRCRWWSGRLDPSSSGGRAARRR